MKRFSLRVLLFFVPILIPVANYLALASTKECVGDISRMAKYFFEKGYHNKLDIKPDSLFVQDLEIQDIPDSSTILCFGDSFSSQRPYPYLQPLGEYFNKTIINVLYNVDNAPEEAALGFLANASTSKLPEILIVESIERSCNARLFWIDTTSPLTLEQLQKGKKHKTSTQKKSIDKEITLFYQYRLGKDNATVFTKLNKACFTSKNNEDELYSYYEDTIHYSNQFCDSAANKLLQLFQFAKERNVILFYVVAPSKSTIYTQYINQRNKFFTIEDKLAFDTLPFFFNPTHTLRSLDKNGEKDIYYADDTHWTPKTAKIVGKELTAFILKQLTTNKFND